MDRVGLDRRRDDGEDCSLRQVDDRGETVDTQHPRLLMVYVAPLKAYRDSHWTLGEGRSTNW